MDGGRLSCPADCPTQVYELLMRDCWLEQYNHRPNFTKLLADVRELYYQVN